MPNVGPYIYDVSISGFTRSSIYIYDISSLRVKPVYKMMMIKYKPVNRSAPFYFARIKKTRGIFDKWLVKYINTANLSDYRLISISASDINPVVDRQDIL